MSQILAHALHLDNRYLPGRGGRPGPRLARPRAPIGSGVGALSLLLRELPTPARADGPACGEQTAERRGSGREVAPVGTRPPLPAVHDRVRDAVMPRPSSSCSAATASMCSIDCSGPRPPASSIMRIAACWSFVRHASPERSPSAGPPAPSPRARAASAAAGHFARSPALESTHERKADLALAEMRRHPEPGSAEHPPVPLIREPVDEQGRAADDARQPELQEHPRRRRGAR